MPYHLREAYEMLFSHAPDPIMIEWQIAEAILDNFNVPKIGENSAKKCIYEIVNHIVYPDDETMWRIVNRAEGFATELWDDLPDEPHMAEIEYKEYEDYSRVKK
jgi:hypothetical protein